jgi:hypothetical protein
LPTRTGNDSQETGVLADWASTSRLENVTSLAQIIKFQPYCLLENLSIMSLGLVQPAAFLWFLSGGEFDVTKHPERAWKIFRQAICCEQVHESRQEAAPTVAQ